MPKKVDRRQRRREIAETYMRIVARDGIEAASTRALVQELGTSTGSLWYWFDSFDELLSESFQLTFARTNERIADRVAGRRGLAALVAMLREIAPLDPVATSEALVVVSFWGRVVTNRAMARHQIAVVYEWGRQFRLRLEEAAELGEIVPEAPVDTLAETLLVLTDGLQIESALGAPLAERDRQWRLLCGSLSPWVTAAGRELIACPWSPVEEMRP